MSNLSARIEEIYRHESRRAFATLVRLLGDLDLAEDALQEAFAIASAEWPDKGIPDNPRSWLVSAGKFKAIDKIRRRDRLAGLSPDIVERFKEIVAHNTDVAERDIEDDRLRLIFTCCHPAIDSRVQVPLTLREVCGLTTEEIADAFLTSPKAMAQRIVRGKVKIRDARIPYVIPAMSDLPQRLDAVLSVIYLIFNEGYSASHGDKVTRLELSNEAIRLGRLVLELLPDPEAMGLVGLMLLHESRRLTRVNSDGDIVLLEDQDRSKWDRLMIADGQRFVRQSLASRQFGFYTLQAAISAVHAEAKTAQETDWNQIAALYEVLIQVDSSPVIELNRAVAIAMRDGPQAGIDLIERIFDRSELVDYHLAHSARGELYRRLGDKKKAASALKRALELASQKPERRFLKKRLKLLRK